MSKMTLKEIVLACTLVSPSFLFGDNGRPPVQQNVGPPVWHDPKNLDQKVIAHARDLLSKGYILYKTAEEKTSEKKLREANTAMDMGVIFLNDAESLLLEHEKTVKAPTIDLHLAQIYTLRGMPDSKEKAGDYELAANRWENFIHALGNVDPNNAFVKECNEKLLKCRYRAAVERMNSGKILADFIRDNEGAEFVKERWGIGTVDEAARFAEKCYTTALPHLKILAKKQPTDPEIAKMLAICYLRLSQDDASLATWRDYARLVPNDLGLYRTIVNIHTDRGEEWKIMGEARFIPHPDARLAFASVVSEIIDETVKKTGGVYPYVFGKNDPQDEGIADLFYEVSKFRYKIESKKAEPDFTYSVADLFLAGLAEYRIGNRTNDDNKRKQAVKRVIATYASMDFKDTIKGAVDVAFKGLVIGGKDIDAQLANDFYKDLQSMKKE